jgi:haloacetate dehalogenase
MPGTDRPGAAATLDARPDATLSGFDYTAVAAGDSTYAVAAAGHGSAVLLLHGFPQDHTCWRRVAPALTRQRTVVLCDLKGVSASRAPRGGPLGEGYAKRDIAAELVSVMAQLGHDRFAVVGHDRGARVAYRMALDHPERVERLCVLNVIPTVEQFERFDADTALEYWPFVLLAQPAAFAEQLIASAADHVVRHGLDTWVATPGAIEPRAAERYVRAFTPATIAAWCADYRAAVHLDREHDAQDRSEGHMITCPVLIHWGASEDTSAELQLEIWRRWTHEVRGDALPGGHFVPEEAADELTASLQAFLAAV